MAVYSDEKIEFFNRATRDSSFKMPEPHFHSKHELYFVEKGKAQYFVGSEIYFLTAGAFSSLMYNDSAELSVILLGYLKNLIPVGIGNIIGGMSIGALYRVAYIEKNKK